MNLNATVLLKIDIFYFKLCHNTKILAASGGKGEMGDWVPVGTAVATGSGAH